MNAVPSSREYREAQGQACALPPDNATPPAVVRTGRHACTCRPPHLPRPEMKVQPEERCTVVKRGSSVTMAVIPQRSHAWHGRDRDSEWEAGRNAYRPGEEAAACPPARESFPPVRWFRMQRQVRRAARAVPAEVAQGRRRKYAAAAQASLKACSTTASHARILPGLPPVTSSLARSSIHQFGVPGDKFAEHTPHRVWKCTARR